MDKKDEALCVGHLNKQFRVIEIEWVSRGVREGQYLLQKWPKFGFGALQRPPIGSRTTGLDPKCSPQLPLIDLSQFQAVASFGG